jgi:hypothetical protein
MAVRQGILRDSGFVQHGAQPERGYNTVLFIQLFSRGYIARLSNAIDILKPVNCARCAPYRAHLRSELFL